MPNSINTLSPSFRDYLLLKNLVTDTVVDNGLQSLLSGIGFPAQTETLPNAVQPSNSIDDTYQIYQEYNTIVNQYQGGVNDYTQVNIIYNPSINSTVGPYNNNNDLLNENFYSNGVLTNSETIRKELTLKNIYVDVPKQLIIDLNTQAVPTYQNLSSYLDENNNLNIGGPSTNALDIIAGVATGQGVGFDFTGGGLIANQDIRSTLLGRVLGATGVINDTPLGNIGGQQLLAHVGYNAAFGLQQETLGKLNLNVLNLIQGGSLINSNYQITTPEGAVGKVLNFAANILGTQSPVSLLQQGIYSFDNKGGFISVGNIERGNEIIKNTGSGQVKSLFDNLRRNTIIDSPNGKTLRQGYAPGYNSGDDGLNPNIYFRGNGDGTIKDFLNSSKDSPISSTNYELSSQINIDGWDKEYFRSVDYNSQKHGAFLYKDSWGWGDLYYNIDSNIALNGDSDALFEGDEKNKKTLLYKTQQLFNSDNMRTLVTGHGVISSSPTQINSAVSSVGNYTSKGSGVLGRNTILTGVDNGPENVFCRTWTTYDRYAQVGDLQKHKGLDGEYVGRDNKKVYRGNIGASVLQDNGFVKIAPISKRLVDNTKFMFSIENLAWAGNDFNLLPCERGPGDGNLKGRIMWFPPYDITFSETTSASWDKHNFIGRGEPMYTYNNTERSGNLSWKIIIDHPNYMNFISSKTKQQGGNFDDLLASYFAGCVDYRDLDDLITTDEKDKTEVVNTQKKPEVTITKETPPDSFEVFFPNDVYDVDRYPNYEDGRCDNDDKSPNLLFTLTGHVDLIEYSEFNSDGSKVVTASFDDTAKIWDSSNGNMLFDLSGHTDVLVTAKFNTDSSKIVTASIDNTAKIWDVSSGNELITLSGHTDGVTSANFNSDGSKIVTSSYDNTAKIWDSSNGNMLFDLVGHTDWVNIAEFNSDGTKVVTGSNDNTAKIWDSSNGNILFSLSGHTDLILSVEFNSDSTKVLSASVDNTVKVWDTSNGNLLNTLSDASALAKFNSDGSKVTVTAIGDTAKIWEISNNNIITLEGHTSIVRSSEFNSDGSKIVTASNDNTVKIWDANTGKLLNTLEGHTDEVNIAKFSLDGNKVVTASNDNTAKIWEVDAPECLINYKVNASGDGFGIGDYNEMCYEYTFAGKKKWSSIAPSKYDTENKIKGPYCNKTPVGTLGRRQPDRNDFGLNAAGGSPNATFFKPVTLEGKTYKSWRDPEYHKDLELYLKNKCKTCKVIVKGYASNQGTDSAARNKELSTLRAENVKKWLETNIFKTPPLNDRIISETGEGISVSRGDANNPCTEKSDTDIISCKANRYVKVEFVIDETLIPKNETGTEKESKNDEPIKTPAISTSRFYTECDYFEKLEQSSPVVYNSIKEQIKYFQPAFHSTTPEGFNARLTFLQQCMRQGPTDGAGSNNNPNNLAFGRPPVCILRIGDFYHTKIVIENLSFSFEPLVWDLNPEGIGVQPMICNVDMSFAFIGGSSLNGPINRLQNAVSFNYYANNEIYDNRPDTIKINGNVTEIVDGEKNITGDKNKASLAQDTDGLTNKVEPVKDQVKEEVVANSGTENSQPLTDENNQPVETPVEKVKKYPGFDEKTGTYTTQFAQILTPNMDSENKKSWSDKIVIPKGTKFYLGSETKNFNVNAIIGDKGINPNKYKLESLIKDTLPNVSPIPSVGKTITKKISLADKIYYNRVWLDCEGIGIHVEFSLGAKEGEPLKTKNGYTSAYYNNAPLEKVLTDIFCKAGKVKTLKEIKQFDNTK
jgi:WD40 repeat protein